MTAASVSNSRFWKARTSSGSSRSARPVNPARSAKSTVTCRRSASPWPPGRRSTPRGATGPPRAVPQCGQNAKSGSQGRPHAAQGAGNRVPHRGQNAKSGDVSAPQPEQFAITSNSTYSTVRCTAFVARADEVIESLFDELIGAQQQRRRDGEAERLRRLEIDGELEPGGLLDGKLCRFRALENALHIRGSAAVQLIEVRPVADETPRIRILRDPADRRQASLGGQGSDALPLPDEYRVGQDRDRFRSRTAHRLERGVDLRGIPGRDDVSLKSEATTGRLCFLQHLGLEDGIGRIPEDRHAASVAGDLLQDL